MGLHSRPGDVVLALKAAGVSVDEEMVVAVRLELLRRATRAQSERQHPGAKLPPPRRPRKPPPRSRRG
jgi:hypothetical protein